jgi:tetratricopeptide (TPR) repeat protein
MLNFGKYFKQKTKVTSNFFSAITSDQALANLNEAKKAVSTSQQVSQENFSELLDNGILALENFITSYCENENDFLKALENLEKAIEMKPSEPEPYFYLAYIFHISGENNLSIKYLNVASLIKPDLKGITKLREVIDKNINYYSGVY